MPTELWEFHKPLELYVQLYSIDKHLSKTIASLNAQGGITPS